MASPRHFLTLLDLSTPQLLQLMRRAGELKQMQRRGEIYEPLKNRVLGMVFEKLKLPNDARLFYETLREKFPKSPLARDAKARLDKLK